MLFFEATNSLKNIILKWEQREFFVPTLFLYREGMEKSKEEVPQVAKAGGATVYAHWFVCAIYSLLLVA